MKKQEERAIIRTISVAGTDSVRWDEFCVAHKLGFSKLVRKAVEAFIINNPYLNIQSEVDDSTTKIQATPIEEGEKR